MSSAPVNQPWYRGDITGLRSVAIIPVVAFHAGASFIPGGFIGVDVFYVISGFLITTLLVREAENVGRIRLGIFWAKRIRRLAPALLLTIAITLPIAALLGSVLGWDVLAAQAVASSLYVANILFWQQSTDYFDTGSGQSPFLHMWSLGVEEQFYIVWPLLIIVAIWLARRALTLRWVLGAMFAVVFAASLALSIGLTPIDPNAAFYLLPTRAWEFAGAGLVALLPLARLMSSRLLASLFAVTGLAVLVAGFIWISEADLYPGYLALVPFVGTLLLIASGSGARSFLAPVFESRTAVWIGNVSYSWYLWHWPLIVFASVLFSQNSLAIATAGVLSLGVGAASYYFVEKPLRFSTLLVSSTRRTYVLGAGATIVVLVLSVGVWGAGASLLRSEPYKTYAAAAETLPSNDCSDGITESFEGRDVCVLGDPGGAITVAVIGDSHAGHWRAVMDQAAQEAGYRLVVRWKSSCPSFDVIVGDEKAVQDPDCTSYREETMDILKAVRPNSVIISNAYGYDGKVLSRDGHRISLEQQREAWRDAMTSQIDAVEGLGARVAIVRDNPRMRFNPTTCLARVGASPSDCESTWEESQALIREFSNVTDQVIADRGIAETLSTDTWICNEGVCQAEVDGLPVYQDQTHLSEMWTRSHAQEVRLFLERSVI